MTGKGLKGKIATLSKLLETEKTEIIKNKNEIGTLDKKREKTNLKLFAEFAENYSKEFTNISRNLDEFSTISDEISKLNDNFYLIKNDQIQIKFELNKLTQRLEGTEDVLGRD